MSNLSLLCTTTRLIAANTPVLAANNREPYILDSAGRYTKCRSHSVSRVVYYPFQYFRSIIECGRGVDFLRPINKQQLTSQ
jgi:hypothetical protein